MIGSLITDVNAEINDFSPGLYLTFGKFNLCSSLDDGFHSELILIFQANPVYTVMASYHYMVEARYNGAEVVIFDHTLSGVQQRNLERELQCRVVDRVALILDIFAQRARSAEGKLQVDLAQPHTLSAIRLTPTTREATNAPAASSPSVI